MRYSKSPIHLGIPCLLLLATFGELPLNAQNEVPRERFTRSQKIGYLGQTSRSAMARNVLERLKNQSHARNSSDSGDRVQLWHEILLDSIAIDHTPDPDTDDVGFEHGGPTRTSRVLAMTQIAVFDAVNSFGLQYVPYNNVGSAPQDASIDAAIAYASFTVQSSLYSAQIERLTALLESDLSQMEASDLSINAGRQIGISAAEAILSRRSDDGSSHAEPDWGQGGAVADGSTTAQGNGINDGFDGPFAWEPDPLTPPVAGDFNLALGAYWGAVTPFSMESGNQFRSNPPPMPGSPDYMTGYILVQYLGASTDTQGSLSNPHTRFVGNYWGYDATPFLGAPPRLYNQIAVQVAVNQGLRDPIELARYLAMINTGLADAGIAAWDSKYFFNYWRPVTAIRRPDNVPQTVENPEWKPVGISVINTENAITPTPPFPAYPSGHSTFGASTFEIMRQFFGNETRFTFISDEYNGEGEDPLGVPRPLVPVRFSTLHEAQRQNGLSRIYNGVHWQWDDLAGQRMGEQIGQQVVFDQSAFQPNEGFLLGDCNGDGSVDLLDIAPFVDLVVSGEFLAAADMDGDGVVSLLDVNPFVEIIINGG